MVSTAVIAQDVQQKDDAKKEAKATKPKKEKKAKEPKAKKEKENKSSSKAAAKTTASKTSKTNKKLKKDTPEYDAQIKASIQAMDSVLKNSRKISNEITPDHMMKFADMQCEKFGDDPEYMDKMAEAFYLHFNDVYGAQRYAELRKKHPTYIDGFISEAKLFNDLGWQNAPEYDPSKLEAAKNLMDSAKVAFPNSTEPYMRWIYWQCPYRYIKKTGYEHLSVDTELEAVKKKFPDYPAYLEVAKLYDKELSQKKNINEDIIKTYIAYAADFYEKSDKASMTPIDIVNFADICNKSNDTIRFAKALDYLNYGISKNPNYPYFYRFKMYIEANYAFRIRKEKERAIKFWENVIETGTSFMERADSIRILPPDYECLANAFVQKKRYPEALENLQKQLDTHLLDSVKEASVLGRIIDCYTGMGEYDSAIETFTKLEQFKSKNNLEMTINDYYQMETAYRRQVADTTKTVETRIAFYNKLDTICLKEAKSSPMNAGGALNRRFNYIMNRIALEKGEQDIKEIDALNAAKDLVKAVSDYQATQNEMDKDPDDTFYLVAGYRAMMVHYYFVDNEEEAYKLSELILWDMPEALELTGLNPQYVNTYNAFKSAAQQINDVTKKKFAKKKSK